MFVQIEVVPIGQFSLRYTFWLRRFVEGHDPRDDLDECTFQPSIFTRRRGAADDNDHSDFYSRLEEDVKRRHDKHAAHGREDSHCKRWFQRQYNDGLRQPHYHDDGIAGKRVIPEAKW